jgi:hypothetical protein
MLTAEIEVPHPHDVVELFRQLEVPGGAVDPITVAGLFQYETLNTGLFQYTIFSAQGYSSTTQLLRRDIPVTKYSISRDIQ